MTAKVHTETVTITCPHCGEIMDEPFTGSTIWTPQDLEKVPTKLTCRHCGKTCDKPRISR